MTCRLDNGGPGHVAVAAERADRCAKAAGPEPKLVTQRAKSATNLLIGGGWGGGVVSFNLGGWKVTVADGFFTSCEVRQH